MDFHIPSLKISEDPRLRALREKHEKAQQELKAELKSLPPLSPHRFRIEKQIADEMTKFIDAHKALLETLKREGWNPTINKDSRTTKFSQSSRGPVDEDIVMVDAPPMIQN